jgi:hypothetical protein
MIKVKFYIIIFLIFTSSAIVAQDYDYGKVSKKELEEKFSLIDSTASAEYLYKYRKTSFDYVSGVGFKLVTYVHERVKIYNKNGFEYATKKIRLYKDGSMVESISKIKAKTYNLVGNKVEEITLKKDGQFEGEISENLNETTFTMPNVKEGSVIEYKYSITSPFTSNIDEFVFQHSIPVRKIEAILETPEYFVFRLNIKGFLKVIPKKEQFNRTLNYSERVASGGGNGTGVGKGLGKTTLRQSNINYLSNVTLYEMNDIKPLKEEPYVNELANYRSGVKYELSYTEFPNSAKKFFSSSWEDVVKTIYKNSRFGDELKKNNYFKKDLDELIIGVVDDQEKVDVIFEFVKSKVKWNNNYGKYTKDGVKEAYQNGVGNVAEINLMLTAMLNYANLESNPVLVSTRFNGIPLFPTREGYNYVVSSVTLNDTILLLDATSQNSLPGILPVRALNWEGRIIYKDGESTVIGLYPEVKSSLRIFQYVYLNENGSIEGKIRNVFSQHQALSFRNSFDSNEEETYLRKLEDTNGGMDITNFKLKNQKDLQKSPTESYDFYTENDIDIIANKIYFTPLLSLAVKENPFKLENREYPMDFSYPFENTSTTTINLPKGYKIDFVPESMAIALPDEIGSFNYTIINSGEMLQLKVENSINYPIIPAEYYPSLKEYYNKMIEKMNEKVVLSKI